MTTELPEENESLWRLAASPSIWALHFLASYVTAAVWCAKFASPDDSLFVVRAAVAVYTVLALGGVAFVGWRGLRRQSFSDSTTEHDFDTRLDRHRFLGFATLLLSGLSAIAIAYAALAAFFMESCR